MKTRSGLTYAAVASGSVSSRSTSSLPDEDTAFPTPGRSPTPQETPGLSLPVAGQHQPATSLPDVWAHRPQLTPSSPTGLPIGSWGPAPQVQQVWHQSPPISFAPTPMLLHSPSPGPFPAFGGGQLLPPVATSQQLMGAPAVALPSVGNHHPIGSGGQSASFPQGTLTSSPGSIFQLPVPSAPPGHNSFLPTPPHQPAASHGALHQPSVPTQQSSGHPSPGTLPVDIITNLQAQIAQQAQLIAELSGLVKQPQQDRFQDLRLQTMFDKMAESCPKLTSVEPEAIRIFARAAEDHFGRYGVEDREILCRLTLILRGKANEWLDSQLRLQDQGQQQPWRSFAAFLKHLQDDHPEPAASFKELQELIEPRVKQNGGHVQHYYQRLNTFTFFTSPHHSFDMRFKVAYFILGLHCIPTPV